MSKLKKIVTVILYILSVSAYMVCPDVEISDYVYKLSELASGGSTLALYENTIIEISLCKSFTCIINNGSEPSRSYDTFIGQRTSTSCQPYSASKPPLKQYYNLSNSDPTLGLNIVFPPVFIQQKLYGTSISLFCKKKAALIDPNASLNTVCTLIENTQQKKTLRCTIYSDVGCPTLAVNSFWIFLQDSSIIFAITFWITALFLLFLGYLAIKGTIWILGVFSGSIFSLLLVAETYTNFITQSNGIYIFIICLSVLLGVTFGITLLTVPKLGYANIGIWVAAIFSLLLQNSVFYLTGSNLALYITFGVSALIMVFISMLELKYYIVLCSSFIGGFFAIRPLGFFLPYYPNELSASRNFSIDIDTPWQFYLYLISIIIIFVLGTAFQICLYKKTYGKYHGKNEKYYLERQGNIKSKLKKVFEFHQIRELVRNGRNEILQLRDLIMDKGDKQNQSQKPAQIQDSENYIQMADFGRKKQFRQQKSDKLIPISDSDVSEQIKDTRAQKNKQK